MIGTLYMVATPIGNLQDITFRAVHVLRSVDVIACEDTRHTRKLLNHLEIKKELISYHEHNEMERAEELVEILKRGRSIAVVSDAGTPGISDPGYTIVSSATSAGANIIPVPGPAAFVSAVTVSGLPTDTIYFGSFLPSKKNERVKKLQKIRELDATLVFYEAPHRIAKSIEDCIEVLGDRRAAVARELTKMHEEVIRGDLTELLSHFSALAPRGEFVLVIDRHRAPSGPALPNTSLSDRIEELIGSGLDRKEALKAAAREFGLGKSEVYRRVELEKKR